MGLPMMVRTWVYVICWAILASLMRAFTIDPQVGLLPIAVFLLVLPWGLDAWLARRSMRQSRWTTAARCLHVVPVLLFVANVLIVRALTRPAEVHHNRHHAMAVELVGGEVPILETWYSQDRVFTGHGGEYLRIRFAPENRAAMEAAVAKHCRVAPASEMRWALLTTSKPTASSMPWDPPSASVTPPRVCGQGPGFQAEFGTSGDSLLLYFEGH